MHTPVYYMVSWTYMSVPPNIVVIPRRCCLHCLCTLMLDTQWAVSCWLWKAGELIVQLLPLTSVWGLFVTLSQRTTDVLEYCDEQVCLFVVCLWASISLELHVRTTSNILYALSIASPRWTVLWYVMYLQIYGWHYNCTWHPECVMQIRCTLYLGSRIRYCNTYLNWPTRTSLDRGRSVTSMIALLMCQFNWWHRLIRKCSTWVHRAFWHVASYSVVRSMAICETHSSHSLAWGLPVHKSMPRGRHSTTPISHRCITSPASVSQDSLQCC